MSASGVAGEIDLRRITAVAENVVVHPSNGGTGLTDDIANGHLRTKIVFDEHDGDAAFGEGRCEVAVVFLAAAAPIAAMDVNEDGAAGPVRGVNVQSLARRLAV